MNGIKTSINRRVVLVATTLLIIGTVVLGIMREDTAHAAPVQGFNPGYIISDNIFTNSQTMTADQIQTFLNSKISACDTNGTLPATEYGSTLTHAQYAATRGWSAPPYVCLKDYTANGLSAAQIIYNTAQTYQINPQDLIVLLQKEQGLVTDTWPVSSEYRSATGYGCPDTSACDSTYYGFTNQITWSAKMFHAIMTQNPNWYTPYVVGNNYIAWNPTSSCGGTTVNVQNLATAALYNYTPYQPNQAALNAGYGSGDSCSSYGNRNFFEYFSDWFGSPQYGNLVRTVNDASVYLVANGIKYPISSMNIVSSLYPLGNVSYVGQSYLDSLTLGSPMSRFIKSSDGTVYFYDSGIKLPFGSCTQVSDYGSACGQAIPLEDSQVNLLVNGPGMTSLMGTTSGKLFYIKNGTKSEAYDNSSLSAAGINDGVNVLNESALSDLPYGSPYLRNGVIVQSRQDSTKRLYIDGMTIYTIKESSSTDKTFSGVTSGKLDDQSIQKMTISPQMISDSLVDEAGKTYILTTDGKKQIPNPQSFNLSPVQISSTNISQLNGTGTLSDPSLIKSIDDATVYAVVNGQKRPLVAMEDLKSITGSDHPYIGWVSNSLIDSIPTGNIIVGAGRLVKSPSNATVYMTDGYDKLVPMSTFDPSRDMGLNMSIRTISDSILSKYTVDQSVLLSYVTCDGVNYVGMGGVAYQLTINGITPRVIQSQTCNVLTKSGTLPGFVHTPDGTIYQLKSGVLYPISSWSTYMTLSANGGSTISITNSTASLLPKGPVLQ